MIEYDEVQNQREINNIINQRDSIKEDIVVKENVNKKENNDFDREER